MRNWSYAYMLLVVILLYNNFYFFAKRNLYFTAYSNNVFSTIFYNIYAKAKEDAKHASSLAAIHQFSTEESSPA